MSRLTKICEGFAKDENGKTHTLPMQLLPTQNVASTSSTKKGEEKITTIKRKFFPIERLQLDIIDFEKSPKKRKIERPVCKQLFKAPKNSTERRFSYKSRQSLTKKANSSKRMSTLRVPKSNKDNINDGSPLINADEAEKLLSRNKKFISPNPKTVFPLSTKSNKIESHTEKKLSTPSQALSNFSSPIRDDSTDCEDREFSFLEKQLASTKKSFKNSSYNTSPMTSVCSLLESTKITNSVQKTNSIEDKIKALLKEDEEAFQQYVLGRQTRINRIMEMMHDLREDKENKIRRSGRIAAKHSVKKFVTSPAVLKDVDLRKSTLNKNLSKNIECNSPTRRALDLYSSMRSECIVLCTPKLERRDDEMPPSVTRSRSLSRKIQKQCLLLQDTPKPS
ncbi:uncharacterized protein LOC123014711 [Tribolium madens]|uniref:uncharacterized protein LOC123014711 n=1 Tax=Tribolium madens TaxID=41895 RepID=UPI001CF72F27|nr:uncharacterized protein LOC123014711 [Tribolium madens]